MSYSYHDYVQRLKAQHQRCPPQPGEYTNYNPVFRYIPASASSQRWTQNASNSQGSNSRYTEPVQHPSPQNGVRSTFYARTPYNHVFNLNQQQKMMDNINNKRCFSQCALKKNDSIIHRIRDLLIDILNSAICKYGVTVSELMVFLKQSCAKDNIILPVSIMDSFEEFLRCEMTDHVEIEDDLCRYRRPTLSIQEESVPSLCERTSNRFETSFAWQSSQNYDVMPPVGTDESSTKKVEKVKTAVHTEFDENKLKGNEFLDGREEHIDANKIISIDDKKCKALLKYVERKALSKNSYTKNDLTKIVEEWKEIFVGDLKELIRYLRMVDDYFLKNDGKFVWSEFKEVFGELNKRWEFCDIDLVEMGVINVVPSNGLNEEPELTVNPIIREVEFPEVAQLAKEVYNLLSKLLQSVDSVKVEVVARTVNFGINNRETVDKKYALLWEVLSDSQLRDIFVVEVLRKQNKERGFDVMIRLSPDVKIFDK